MHKNKYIPWEPWTYEFVGHESKTRLFWLAHCITWVSIEKPGFSQQCLKNGFEKHFLTTVVELRHLLLQTWGGSNTEMLNLIDEINAIYAKYMCNAIKGVQPWQYIWWPYANQIQYKARSGKHIPYTNGIERKHDVKSWCGLGKKSCFSGLGILNFNFKQLCFTYRAAWAVQFFCAVMASLPKALSEFEARFIGWSCQCCWGQVRNFKTKGFFWGYRFLHGNNHGPRARMYINRFAIWFWRSKHEIQPIIFAKTILYVSRMPKAFGPSFDKAGGPI